MRKIIAGLLAVVLLCGCTAGSGPEGTSASVHREAMLESSETTVPVSVETEPSTQIPAETEMPTTEQTESPATEPVSEPADTDFALITDYIPTARIELAYATEDNFSGVVIYDFTDAYLRYGTLKKLMSAAQMLAEYGYGLVIWDAYRPVYGQQRLWEAYPNAAYVSTPGTGVQSHCRGVAVDLTLYDLQTGELLEMPTGFDDFTAYADRNYSDNSAAAAANATLLETIMAECGFKPYSAEWWHFSDTNSYDIEYEFDPAEK